MQRLQAAKNRVSQAARHAIARAGELTQRSAVQFFDEVQARTNKWREGAQGKALADSVLKAGEQVIDKSPLPVPVIVRDALGRMQDALGQLGNALEAVDAGAGADSAKDVANIKHGKGGMHFAGKVAPSDDDAASFSQSHQRKGKGQHKHAKV